MVNEILKVYRTIYKKDGGVAMGEKEKAIVEYLRNLGLNPIYNPKYGIYLKFDNGSDKDIVITSHYDLIPKFKKVKDLEIKNDIVKGALDNTITNAALLLYLKNNLDKFKYSQYNYKICFTNFEEVGFIGMENLIKIIFKKNIKNKFFINLDVTNENYNKGISIEAERINLGQVRNYIRNKLYDYFTPDRFADDLDVVMLMGGFGVSYCLATAGIIHSFNNRTKLKHIELYYRTMDKIFFETINEKTFDRKTIIDYNDVII